MFKKCMLVLASLLLCAGLAQAAVDVNKADQAALDGIRGIGPTMSKRILDEREKGGAFKDWSDLRQRVKGIKDKSAAKLSGNGLTVNGQPMPGTQASKPAKPVKSPAMTGKGSKVEVAGGEAMGK